ncbi:hypothetical protein LO749_18845 [Paracoccus denitrificans]|uniref:hypothetical protein n=1 Tax=Paracoccus denitrificans TaxID=266 RepID=UPI001E511BCD|nr:hypothetical protein [Paracoccus denitrificans]UFS66564.1 hypothetical protein LO749_18845 [Paracoccus denitrificans]
MAKQDDYTRYTIRIPTPLYERVKAAAGEKSVNAEIVEALEQAYPDPDPVKDLLDKAVEALAYLETNPAAGFNELTIANKVVDHARVLLHASRVIRGVVPPEPTKRPRRKTNP